MNDSFKENQPIFNVPIKSDDFYVLAFSFVLILSVKNWAQISERNQEPRIWEPQIWELRVWESLEYKSLVYENLQNESLKYESLKYENFHE